MDWQLPTLPGVYIVAPRDNPLNIDIWQFRRIEHIDGVSDKLLRDCVFCGPVPDVPRPPTVLNTGKCR